MNNTGYTLEQLAATVGGEARGNPGLRIEGIAPFDQAQAGDITLAGTPRFLKQLETGAAGAFIVPPKHPDTSRNLLVAANPQVAFAKLIEVFHPPELPRPGIRAEAVIGEAFSGGQNVYIGANAVVGDRVKIGDDTRICPGVVIGDDVTIGANVLIHPNVTVGDRSVIGNRVTIHPGTVIGSDGFGFAPDGSAYYKIPHTGYVHIDDDVEIGACNTIDRGTFGRTYVGKGVKTDNLVQIAHNVTVGDNTILVAQVGISGSVTIGQHAILAGQAGISGHLDIGDNAIIGPQCGVAKSVPAGAVVSGAPHLPHKHFLRVQRALAQLPDTMKRLAAIEKRLDRDTQD